MLNELSVVKYAIITDPYVTSSHTSHRSYLRHRFLRLRRSTSPSHNPQGFLAAASDRGACVTSANSKLPAMKAAFESPDIPGYVYLLEHSRASDGGGSKVDRRGIETYLLAQLAAPVHQLPLSIRGNFGYPLPSPPSSCTTSTRDTHFSNLFPSLYT